MPPPTVTIHYLIASEPRGLCYRPNRPEPAITQYYGKAGLRLITGAGADGIGIIKEARDRHPPNPKTDADFDKWLKAALAMPSTPDSAQPEGLPVL